MVGIICPICHSEIDEESQAYLDDCFHSYCFECIQRWTQAQKNHPPTSRALRLNCPLCKAEYASIIYECKDSTFRRLHVSGTEESRPSAEEFFLTSAQRSRRSVYFSQGLLPEVTAPSSIVQGASWQQLCRRPDLRLWVERELRAVLLEDDVTLVAAVVLAATQAAQQEAAAFQLQLESAVLPFLADKSDVFARELHKFAASGKSLTAYDRSNLHHQDQSECIKARDAADDARRETQRSFSGSAAESSELSSSPSADRSGLARSDSDDYLELLLHKNTASTS